MVIDFQKAKNKKETNKIDNLCFEETLKRIKASLEKINNVMV